ncbi:dispanin subfamily A member 2b-like [Pelobates fuscus]|uniref:dispanin subfamily A member 2b-like n=1 Tax=Pelobates fuscus TaxID=191477 RepID=UPI002FE4CB45
MESRSETSESTVSDDQPLFENTGIQYMNSFPIQDTSVAMPPVGPPIRDHLAWSIFNMVYMNVFCLGLLALVYSVRSRDRKLNGDVGGAKSYGLTSRSLNIAATVLSLLVLLIIIIVLSVKGYLVVSV